MSVQFQRIASGTVYTIPRVSMDGDDPASVMREQAGDIVVRRNGLLISARSYADVKVWTLSFPILTKSEIESLRTYKRDRVFNILPTGDPGYAFEVYWGSSFSPRYIGNGKYSLKASLEQTI